MLNMNASSEKVVCTWRSPNRICFGFQRPMPVAASRSARCSAVRSAAGRVVAAGSPLPSCAPNQPLPADHVSSTANENNENRPTPSLRANSILPPAHAITGAAARRTCMIRLYTAGTPNGRKASIALEELGLRYEVKRVNLQAEEQLRPEFLALNPNHKIPVLDDDGLVVWESGAILLHLGERHDPEGRILPRDPRQRIAAIQYAFFQTGGIGPNLGRLGAALRKPGEKNAEMIEIFAGEVRRLIGVLDRILGDGRPFLAGVYSIGDIMHYPWLRIMLDLGAKDLVEQKRVTQWLERIGARPAVQRGMAVPAPAS